MRRLVIAVAFALSVVGGAAALAVVPAGAVERQDDKAVCVAVAQNVYNGLKGFADDMGGVASQVGAGNLAAADAAVRGGGVRLVALGTQLDQNAAGATDPNLKAAVSGLAAELKAQGQALTGLAALPNVNMTKASQWWQKVNAACGSPSATPNPSDTLFPGVPSALPTS